MENRELILSVIGENSASIWDVCVGIWKLISQQSKEEEKRSIFKTFLQDIDLQDSIELTESFIQLNDKKPIVRDNRKLLNRIVEELIKKNDTIGNFYNELFDKINDDILFPSENDKIAVLVNLEMDNRIPYYQLDLVPPMEDEQFSELCEEINDEIKKGVFALCTEHNQTTQLTTQLIKISEQLKTEEEKSVFWAVIFTLAQQFTRKSVLAECEQKDEIQKTEE